MFRKFHLITVFAVITILSATFGQIHAQTGTAFLRAVHYLTGVPKIDIYVDGKDWYLRYVIPISY